jgi:hypothetical protein
VGQEHRQQVRRAAAVGATESAGWQGFLNNHDPARDHGLSSFDVAHRFVASFVWNLPFGKGEKWAGDATGLKQALIGGWQINGIYLLQGGMPLSVFARDLGNVLDTFGTNRANIVGDIRAAAGTSNGGSTPPRSRNPRSASSATPGAASCADPASTTWT